MRDFTIKIYTKLINTLLLKNYSFETFCDFLNHKNEPAIILRHDVDRLPLNSLLFAQIQSQHKIKGTYYFRALPQSYDPAIIKEIASMGHEIGYHYETLATCKGDIDKAYDEFCRNLETFRKIVPVTTICMHGSPLSRYDNRDIWKKYDYRELGIIGEPYFDIDFNEVLYLTDTGRCWDGERFAIRDKVVRGREGETKRLRDEETKRRRDGETKRLRDEETERRRDEETKRLRDEETERRRDEETKRLRDEETKRRRDGETKRLRDEETERRRDEETKRRRDEETKRRRDEEMRGEIVRDEIVSSSQSAVGSQQSPTRNQKPETKNINRFHSTFDIISAAENNDLPKNILITFHPQRWSDKPWPWLKELVWQGVKNRVKGVMVRGRDEEAERLRD